MSPVIFDSVVTAAITVIIVTMGVFTLVALPWTDQELKETDDAMRRLLARMNGGNDE